MQDVWHEEAIDIDYEAAKQEYELELLEQEKESYPKLVFKYKSLADETSIGRMIDILQNDKVYLPKMTELNDPLEGLRSKMLDGYAEQQKDEIAKYRVFALSADGFLSTLWAYYADDYKGVCLCYRTDQTFSGLEQVEYIVKHSTRTWSVDPELTVRKDIKRKSAEWAHENEWRYIRKSDSDKTEFLHYAAEELVCVFLGPKMDTAVRDRIMQNIPAHVKVFTVEPDNERFCLYAKDKEGHKVYNTQEILDIIEA